MKITDLINFEIKEDYVQGSNGKFYFFRIIPPNLTIMNPDEKRAKIRQFEGVLNNNDLTLQILAMDKTEDLTKNKAFWKQLPERYEAMTAEILDTIGEIEYTNSGIQRAYYFVIKPQEQEQVALFENLIMQKEFRFYRVARAELITVMKNFFLRDFIDFDIYTFEREVQALYESQKGTAK